MSSHTHNWFEQKWIDGMIHTLQSGGYLTKGMARLATDVKAATATWRIAGTGEATEMNPAIEERPAINGGRTSVSATIRDYEANDWVNVMDLKKMSIDEVQVTQQTVAMSLGRKYDKIHFAAMDAEASGITTVGDGSTAIGILNVLEAQADILGPGINVPREIYVGLPYRAMAQLMLYREFASADYVGPDFPLRKQLGAKTWLGMHIVPFPNDYFAVPSANQWDGYMWLKDCLGFATPTDAEGMIREATRIDYVPTKKAYFVASTMSAAAKVIQPAGVRRLRFTSNTAFARPTP